MSAAKSFVTALVLVCVSAGCGTRNAYVEPPPPEVSVVTPAQRSVTEYLEFSGMTQPIETVEIRARVKGFLKERHFLEGADVQQGQLLLVIDEETFQIQLDAARTRLKEAEAALRQATVSKGREVSQAQVKLGETQLNLARQDEQRLRKLADRKAVSDAELEQASSTREAREAELESARARFDQETATYDTTILSCQAQVESAKIAVRNAQLDLSYCRMSAPISGRISRVNFDIGNLVGDGEASVLATIVKIDPIYAYATISEADVMRTPALAQFGATAHSQDTVPVELGTADQKGFPTAGRLDYADAMLDAATGTLRTRGVFPNTDRRLLPGMFVRMRIPVAQRPNAWLVPERALGTDQSGHFVLVVNSEGKVEYRPVRIGVAIDDLRVVEGAIDAADQVIVEGLLRARPGAKVTAKLAPPPPSVAAETPASGRR